MTEEWGECVPLGAISGAPFGGKKTGYNAFSHNVPEGGHVMIFVHLILLLLKMVSWVKYCVSARANTRQHVEQCWWHIIRA